MYICKHGCGKQLSTRGGMNLHESVHCSKRSGGNSEGSGSAAGGSAGECEKGGSHAWRALNSRELHALKANGVEEYAEVCAKCKELQ